MTGPEHYREAERLIAMARDHGHEIGGILYRGTQIVPPLILADAQVHAILALAAATGVTSNSQEWTDVAGPKLSN